MDTTQEIPSSPEREKIVDHAWLFDVDGVITHPEKKQVTEPELFDEIIKRLKNGEPVASVTGRSLTWMIDRVVSPLEKRIGNKKLLENFFGLGEKGGAWLTFEGELQTFTDSAISVPQFLQEEARKLVEEKFADTMFFDESKQTMISIEMKDGISVAEFRVHQQKLNELLKELLEQRGLTKDYKVDPTRIATDVENIHVGKALGARKVLEWLNQKGMKPKRFITFGDSKSDVDMAQEIYGRGLPVEFVFVGEKEQLEGLNLPFPITITQAQCEKGTLEYLK